jgi:hypothetical protein
MTRSHVCCASIIDEIRLKGCSSLTVYEALAVPYTRPHLRAFTAKKAISSDLYVSRRDEYHVINPSGILFWSPHSKLSTNFRKGPKRV